MTTTMITMTKTKQLDNYYTSLEAESGDPSGQTWNYRGITLLYNFTTALLLYGVVSHNG